MLDEMLDWFAPTLKLLHANIDARPTLEIDFCVKLTSEKWETTCKKFF